MENLLNRESLLAKEKLKVEKVNLNETDYVFVRQMTGRERDIFERSLYTMDRENKVTTRLEDFRAKLAVCTVCDDQGKLLLQPSDYTILSQNMSASRLEKIVNAAQKLNAITEEDKEALVKNSVAGQPGSSPSDFVGNSK